MTIDTWWDQHVEQQEGDLVELHGILSDFDSLWADRDVPSDRDPLIEDWTGTNPEAGPLRRQEENWSQWLAHLLRSGPATFIQSLFGESFALAPKSVRREKAFHDEDLHDRRVDMCEKDGHRAVYAECPSCDETVQQS